MTIAKTSRKLDHKAVDGPNTPGQLYHSLTVGKNRFPDEGVLRASVQMVEWNGARASGALSVPTGKF